MALQVTKNSSVIRHKLPSVDEFQEYSRKIGVTRDSLVVIYDHSEESHNRSIMSATYTWWLFKTFGHHKVAVMNGGISKWKASGHLLTSNQTKIVPGNINASWNPSYLVQFDEVLDYVKMNLNLKSKLFQLIDARPIDQFLGKVNLGNAKFAGHIIDAVNFPIDLVLNTDGSIKELSTIEALLKIAGLQLDQFTIVYCNTGLQASTVVFVLTQLGVPVKLFEGNWVEWSFKAPLELSVLPKSEQK